MNGAALKVALYTLPTVRKIISLKIDLKSIKFICCDFFNISLHFLKILVDEMSIVNFIITFLANDTKINYVDNKYKAGQKSV